jgi:hypothetical protein
MHMNTDQAAFVINEEAPHRWCQNNANKSQEWPKSEA